MSTEALNPPETKTAAQRREDRKVVTPYAFGVAEHLIGTRLASPMRRGMAILIDLLCVAMLTHTSSLLLAGLVAWAFFRAGNRLKQKKRFNFVRIILRFFAAFLLFIFALGVFDYAQESVSGDKATVSINTEFAGVDNTEAVALSAKYLARTWTINQDVKNGKCEQQIDCWLPMANELGEDLANVNIGNEDFEDTLSGISEGIGKFLNEEELDQFNQAAVGSFNLRRKQNLLPEQEISSNVSEASVSDSEPTDDEASKSSEPSLLDWIFAIADDFGIGFGWAAFYFSVFVAWWKGQTPGKKLMGIRVLKLDGTPLNLWESFERYGGYAAGLVTGLLGFIQIFWDANRQGIQDKIAETVVIRTSSDGLALKKGLKPGG